MMKLLSLFACAVSGAAALEASNTRGTKMLLRKANVAKTSNAVAVKSKSKFMMPTFVSGPVNLLSFDPLNVAWDADYAQFGAYFFETLVLFFYVNGYNSEKAARYVVGIIGTLLAFKADFLKLFVKANHNKAGSRVVLANGLGFPQFLSSYPYRLALSSVGASFLLLIAGFSWYPMWENGTPSGWNNLLYYTFTYVGLISNVLLYTADPLYSMGIKASWTRHLRKLHRAQKKGLELELKKNHRVQKPEGMDIVMDIFGITFYFIYFVVFAWAQVNMSSYPKKDL